jgi:transmembrane sensor
LHGDNPKRVVKVGFECWLREDPENVRAFKIAAEVWEDAGRLRRFVWLRPEWVPSVRPAGVR